MTAHGPLRARLAQQYAKENRGIIVGAQSTVTSPPLMHSYLQFLTRRRIPALTDPREDTPTTALDWSTERVGSRLMRWADYTPGPYVPEGEVHAHRGVLWPWRGDIVVFGGARGHLGIYLDHEGDGLDAIWEVFTQGPSPAATYHFPVHDLLPLGWWRVQDEWIAKRDQPTRALPQVIA